MTTFTYNLTAEYASQATELNNRIPYGYVNKTVCGCGLTSLALENNRNTVVAVPNAELVTNKIAQYPNERFNGKVFGVLAGVMPDDIEAYVNSTATAKKIMVTYDSLWKVEKYINGGFDLIIDESEQLLKSQGLKLQDKGDIKDVDVLTKLFRIAEANKERLSFISATPIPVEYLPTWVSTLDQVVINWSGTTKAKAYLMERTYPFKSLREEIIKPLNENGKITINDVETDKVIVFVNSVTNIVKIAKECELDPSDVALVVGDNLSNDIKIKGYNRLQNPKVLPKFTFITSIGFQGIDLYDPTAFSIVVSNTSKTFTMVDMMTDLKQAISRQRTKTNKNYGKYAFIYNQNVYAKTEEELLAEINKAETAIRQAIEIHKFSKESGNMEGFELLASDSRDFKTYTVYNVEKDIYEINSMAFNADKYLIIELRRQFEKGFDIRSVVDNTEEVNKVEMTKDIKYSDMVKHYKEMLLATKSDWGIYSTRTEWISIIETSYRMYQKLWTNVSVAKEMIANYTDEAGKVAVKIRQMFNVGQRYTRADVKEKLANLYKKENIKRTAKHTDISEYFEVKEVKVMGERMVEITKRK